MASIPTINFSQFQWEINDQDYLTKWNNFQSAINTLQNNINKFGAEAKAESDSAVGIAQSLIEAYSINVLEPFRRKATIDLDFERGIHRVDDGTLTETKNPADILSISRNTVHNSWAPNKVLNEYADNSLARGWDLESGKPLGWEVSREKTNNFLWSTNLTNTIWHAPNIPYVSVSESTYIAPTRQDGVDKFFKLEVSTEGNFQARLDQDFTVSEGERVSVSALIHKDFNRLGWAVFRVAGDRVAFDLTTGELSAGQLAGGIYKTYDLGDCYLISVSHISPVSGSVQDGVWFQSANSVGVLVDFQVGDYGHIAALQWERGTPSNYIPTQSSPVSRLPDNAYRNLGAEFNPEEFTVYWEGYLNTEAYNDSSVLSAFKVGTADSLFFIQRFPASLPSRMRLLSTVFGATPNYTFPINGDFFKIAVSVSAKRNTLEFSVNGESISKSLDGTLDTKGDFRLQFSQAGFFSQPIHESIIKKVIALPGYSTLATLNALTAQ